MSLSSHNNVSVGSEQDKEDEADAGRCFSRVYDWIPIYVASTGLLKAELQNQGGNWALQYLESHTRCYFLKGKIP